MSFYENVFIVRQDLSQTQVMNLTETYTKIITDLGGQVKDTEQWGLKEMTYAIRKNRRGHYVMLKIQAPTEAIEELRRQMRLSEDILRSLIVKVDALEEGPSAMMKQIKYREREHHSYDQATPE